MKVNGYEQAGHTLLVRHDAPAYPATFQRNRHER